MTYQFLDSGDEKKLEAFGPYTLVRPSLQALWPRRFPSLWKEAHATFDRQLDRRWQGQSLPPSWNISFHSLKLKLALTEFGHLGLFPEHAEHWGWMKGLLKRPSNLLNLFAYSGATTLALAQAGHRVCHLDASEKMVRWARENAALNGLTGAPIRWIVDDALKFVRKEERRGVTYDAIILDPPSFGRGNRGEVFKIERDLYPLLTSCRKLLTPNPSFILLTAHTPGLTPTVLSELLDRALPRGDHSFGEMVIKKEGNKGQLPSGAFAKWVPHG